MNTQQPFAIIANVPLDAFPSAIGTGLWEGLKEPVGMFLIEGNEHEQRLVDYAKKINESAIVVVDANRMVHLVWTNGNVSYERLGRWTEVTHEQARHLDAWTEIDGRYFTTTK